MKINRKLLLVGAAVMVVLLLFLTLRPSAVEVETATVRRDTLHVDVVAEGKTRVHDRYVVAAPVAGRLRRLDIREGTDIVAGQVVAQQDPAPEDSRAVATLRAQLAAAEARQAGAEAIVMERDEEAAQASREAARQRKLADGQVVSRQSTEEAELAATTAAQAANSARSAPVQGLREGPACRCILPSQDGCCG